MPSSPVPYIPTLKVDLVGLPEVLKKDIKTYHQIKLNQEISEVLRTAEAQANRIQATHQGMTFQSPKTPSSQVANRNLTALNRIKALAKIQDSQDSTTEATTTTTQNRPIKGNQISPGSSLSGDAKEAALTSYYDALRDKIQSKWVLPPWLSRQNLSAQVQIMINANGKLIALTWIRSSGNEQFDQAIQRTLNESQPFPSPNEELLSLLANHGVLIGFPL